MKLTFHGENLAEIHKQIIDAAATIMSNVSSRTATETVKISETLKIKTPITDALIKQGASEIINQVNCTKEEAAQVGMDVAAPQADKTVLWGPVPVNTQPFIPEVRSTTQAVLAAEAEKMRQATVPQPGFNQAVAQAEEVAEATHFDGHRVSNGSVWVPVEGRSNAFTGIPIDRYLAQKAAKDSGAELDSKGTPWDANIHTSTKLKTQSGEWKKRAARGSKVEAAPVATPAPVFQAPAPPMAQQAVHIPNNTPTWQPNTPQVAPVVEVPQYEQSSAPIGMAPAGHTYASFKANLQMVIVKLINERKIERDYVKELADYFQVQNIWEVVNDDNKCNELFKSFIENGFITGM